MLAQPLCPTAAAWPEAGLWHVAVPSSPSGSLIVVTTASAVHSDVRGDGWGLRPRHRMCGSVTASVPGGADPWQGAVRPVSQGQSPGFPENLLGVSEELGPDPFLVLQQRP